MGESYGMNARRPRVALVYYSTYASFIRKDYEHLTKHFDVLKVNLSSLKSLPALARAVSSCDVSFTWFAGNHAFPAVLISRILGKGAIVIVGGYDVAYEPEIKYGPLTWSERLYTKAALKYADKVLVVDPSLKMDAIKNIGIDAQNFEYLPTGYDSSKFISDKAKETVVLTVASNSESWDRVRIKGIDVFVECAKYIPDVRFLVIGTRGDALSGLMKIAPPNVEFIGQISQEELIGYYQKAKVYCQLSIREGLPNALCEAMLCECIPVGTERNGIPTAIGDTGFLVPNGDPLATAEAIGKALNASRDLGRKARQRIIDLFPEEKRELGLVQAIRECIMVL